MAPAIVGGLSFFMLHAVFVATWQTWFTGSALEQPWFLGSRRSIVVSQIALFGVALAVGLMGSGSWLQRFRVGGVFLGGVLGSMACLLFILGPEKLMEGPTRLWPMVLISGLLLVGPAVLVGTWLAGLVKGVG